MVSLWESEDSACDIIVVEDSACGIIVGVEDSHVISLWYHCGIIVVSLWESEDSACGVIVGVRRVPLQRPSNTVEMVTQWLYSTVEMVTN